MLFHSHVPLKFLVDAFSTAAFTINQLPMPTLDGLSPFKLLYGKPPIYSTFHPFGCLVFPYLRDYASHKLVHVFFLAIVYLTMAFVVLIVPLHVSLFPGMLFLTNLITFLRELLALGLCLTVPLEHFLSLLPSQWPNYRLSLIPYHVMCFLLNWPIC